MLIAFAIVFVLIVGLLVYAALRPSDFRVQRSITIKAAPEKIFALIDDFHAWAAWSPWEKLDPDMRRVFNGAGRGVGSHYAWEGNKKVGAGSMELISAKAPTALTIKLDFIRPFEGHNIAEFNLEPGAEGTTVSWAMRGSNPFMFRLVGIFLNLDQLIGKDFEAGLAKLKGVAEG